MEAVLRRELSLSRKLNQAIAVFVFTVFTALGGFVRIPLPFSPVPLTLQTFFVLLGAALLGSAGVLPQIAYVLLGTMGLPVFSGAGSGIAYLCGPTAGYLAGFILAALFVVQFIKYCRNNLILVLGMLFLADLALLFCGIAWLKLLFGYPWGKLFFIGVLPFIPGDLIKSYCAAILYLKLKNRFREVLPGA